jgi:outer membrane protein assembly factor BamD
MAILGCMKMKTLRLTAVMVLALLGAFGTACTGGGPRKPPTGTLEPDKFLFERGKENLEKKRWLVAREYFRQLIDSYPQSQYRAEAKLGLGDTYLGERSSESFVLATNEFREFLNFYPTHQRAHYAQFQLAMTHFKQMRAPMRDQTETRDAVRELQAYVTRYADQPLIGEARAKLREAKDRLDDWDAGVAQHYFRIKWYPGVVGRLVPMLVADPEYTRRDRAFIFQGE